MNLHFRADADTQAAKEVRTDQPLPVAATVQGAAADGATASGNPVPVGGIARDTASLPSYTAGKAVELGINKNNGALLVEVQDGLVLGPATSGGCDVNRQLDLGVTGQVVKASAGQIYGYYFANQAASFRWVKIYNKATAPTQADTPILTLGLPATSAGHVPFPQGIAFGTGISLRASTGIADNDTGAPTANDVSFNTFYK